MFLIMLRKNGNSLTMKSLRICVLWHYVSLAHSWEEVYSLEVAFGVHPGCAPETSVGLCSVITVVAIFKQKVGTYRFSKD